MGDAADDLEYYEIREQMSIRIAKQAEKDEQRKRGRTVTSKMEFDGDDLWDIYEAVSHHIRKIEILLGKVGPPERTSILTERIDNLCDIRKRIWGSLVKNKKAGG